MKSFCIRVYKISLLAIVFIIFCLMFYRFLFYQQENKQENTIKGKVQKKFAYGVSASHPIAVEEGMKILKHGGNAVDAAITMSYVLGVVEPYASGLGGGGGMLIVNKDGESNFIDYREIAPSYLDDTSTIGIPGFVAGMEFAHEKFGSIPISELLQPSIYYAENGFEVDDVLFTRLADGYHRIYSEKLNIFYPNGKPLIQGEKLVQSKLTSTLKKIQENGAEIFYKGNIANEINELTNISLSDIKKYKVEERKPVVGDYHDFKVYTAPPPFSGVTLIQMLKQTEINDSFKSAENIETYIKSIGKITRFSYQDRIKNIGNPRFSKMQSEKWVSNQYLSSLLEKEDTSFFEEEHESTTHFVVMDQYGTIVSATNTLSNFFGSGKYIQGFFLNNQLSNFSNNPNQIQPGKRSRTFMGPTILEKKGETFIGIGSPGGNRIPQILTLILDKYFHTSVNLQEIVDEERFLFEKNNLYTEMPLPPSIKKSLLDAGYNVIYKDSPVFYGGVQALIRDEKKNSITGAGDGRRNGTWKSNK